MNAADVIRGALELLGENGERWIKGHLQDDQGGHCLAGALWSRPPRSMADHYAMLDAARYVNDEVYGPGSCLNYAEWNDDPHTTFEDVRLVLKRVLARAEESDV